jgi:hypothetical protein
MLMVEHIENNWHQIYEELGRWISILAEQWDRFKLTHTPGS